MTIMEQLRDIPAVGSGRANQVPRAIEMANPVVYLKVNFVGSTYVLAAVEEDEEDSPEARFRILIDVARRSDGNDDYPDSPDQVQERAELTRALYQSQAEAISARDDRRHESD
jgi:hypothetical protein